MPDLCRHPWLSSRRHNSRPRLARLCPPPRRARGTRRLHNVPLEVGSAPTVVVAAVVAVAGTHLLARPHHPMPRATPTRPSTNPGPSPCRCGHTAAHLRPSRPSRPSRSMAGRSTAFPAAMAPATLRHRRTSTGDLHPQHQRSRGLHRTVKCLHRHPGTPLMAMHGSWTRWCNPSTLCRSPRLHHPNGMPTRVPALT